METCTIITCNIMPLSSSFLSYIYYAINGIRPKCRLRAYPTSRARLRQDQDTLPASHSKFYIEYHTRSSSGIPCADIAKRDRGVPRACQVISRVPEKDIRGKGKRGGGAEECAT